MSGHDAGAAPAPEGERRRVERRASSRLADLSLPEFRRIAVTTLLSGLVIAAFIWMVRDVIIAGLLGVIFAVYVRPLYLWMLRRTGSRTAASVLAQAALILPVLAAIIYSYAEILDIIGYLAAHQEEVSARIDGALRRIVFFQNVDTGATVRRWVLAASQYGAAIPNAVREAVVGLGVAVTIFVFTVGYIFSDGERVVQWTRATVPPRYQEFVGALERNVRGVLYGVLYGTLTTQAIKAAVIFLMNVLFSVPLAGALAVLSFIIGFFPIVGSWSVYVPVAAWLFVWRDSPAQAALMLAVGFLLNTLFISMYLRPKLAADRSKVLNFYWMFVGLVTGVYTFGLAGVVLGPALIGLLKAVTDTVTQKANWRLIEADGDDALPPAELIRPSMIEVVS